jgi:hypothetical protein
MIFFNKYTIINNKYGPIIGFASKCNMPNTFLTNYYLIWAWSKKRWSIGWNPLKRIKKGEI